MIDLKSYLDFEPSKINLDRPINELKHSYPDIQEFIYESTPRFGRLFKALNEYYDTLIEFFGEDEIPEKYIDYIYSHKIVNPIWENLRSHDWKLLSKKIQELFKNDIIRVDNYTTDFRDKNSWESIGLLRLFWEADINIKKILENKKFQHLIEFFNYRVREYSIKHNYIALEPLFTEPINEYIHIGCKGILYHITTKDDAEKIKKNGLRCKDKSNSSVNYPKRIYCLATDRLDLRKLNKDYLWTIVRKIIKKDKYDVAKNDYSNDELKQVIINDLAIFRINLNKLNNPYSISFYKDLSMNETECVFCMQNIPSVCLMEINAKKLFNSNN